MTNCVVHNCIVDNSASALSIISGLVTHSSITNNDIKAGEASAVYVTGGALCHSSVSHNTTTVNECFSAGIRMSGGLVADCDISYNYGPSHGYGKSGIGIAGYQTGGIMERCTITHNTNTRSGYSYAAGGIFMEGTATNRNCLFAYNVTHSASSGAGICMNHNKSVLENATIVGNNNASSSTCEGLRIDNGTVRNSIIYNNGVASADVNVYKKGGSIFNSCYPESDNSNGCTNVAPGFVDLSNGDFRLMYGSACIDAGMEIATVVCDLNGSARPFDGNFDNTVAIDMGCYEYGYNAGETFVCSFTLNKESFYDGDKVVLTAVSPVTLTSCSWTILKEGGEPVIYGPFSTYSYETTLGVGRYKVWLTAKSGDNTATSFVHSFSVVPKKIYVNLTGSPQYPYATPATAARTVEDAVSVYKGCTVLGKIDVAPGDYNFKGVVLDAPIEMVCEDGEAVVDGEETSATVITLSHKDALLSGFVFENYKTPAQNEVNSIINLYAGTMTNCVIRMCRTDDQYARVLYVTGGLVTHSVISNNFSNSGYSSVSRLNGGSIVHTRYLYNQTPTSESWSGCVQMSGGYMADCEFAFNKGHCHGHGEQGMGIAAYQTGGLMERCVFTNNTNERTANSHATGAIRIEGTAIKRNCLYAYNTSKGSSAGAVSLNGSSAILENATIYGNNSPADVKKNGVTISAGTMRNCIIYGNGKSDVDKNVYQTGGNIYNSCYPESDNSNGCTNAAPAFVKAEEGDLHLSYGSPCIDTGMAIEGLTDDLEGKLRPVDGNFDSVATVDMGCYEYSLKEGEKFACAFTTDKGSYNAPATVVLTPTASTAIARCEWMIECNGKTVTEKSDGGGQYRLNFSDCGIYTITLKAYTANDNMSAISLPIQISITPTVTYVSPTGKHIWPYDSETNAATNLIDAVEIFEYSPGGGTVYVAAGDYAPVRSAARTSVDGTEINYIAALEHPIKIIGAGKDKVILRAIDSAKLPSSNKRTGGILMSVEGTLLEGVTIIGTTDGVAAAVLCGIFRDSNVTGCISTGKRANVTVVDGYVSNVTITNNVIPNGKGSNAIAGVYIKGDSGVVTNCVISGNIQGWGESWTVGAVVEKGRLVDCVISDNSTAGHGSGINICGGSLHITGGTVERCVFLRNKMTANNSVASNAGILVNGGSPVIRNVLVAECDSVDAGEYAAIHVSGGSPIFENITVVGNTNRNNSAKCGVGFNSTTTVRNAIIANNGGSDSENASLSGIISYSRYGGATEGESGNTKKPVKFKNTAKGDYRLSAADKMCINGGDPETVCAPGDIDLNGEKRKVGARVDMGCYEYPLNGLSIIIR